MRTAILLLALCTSPLSWATLIEVDPDAFAAGTQLNNAFSGVTLSATGVLVDNGTVDPDIFSTEASSINPALAASTGSRVFGVNPNQFFPRDWLVLELRADFAQPTDYVSLDFIGYVDPIPGSEDRGMGVLAIYDSTDSLITELHTGSLILNEVRTLDYSGSDIAYVVARMQGIDTPVVTDRLRFNVPEPHTIFLFIAGLLLIGRLKHTHT